MQLHIDEVLSDEKDYSDIADSIKSKKNNMMKELQMKKIRLRTEYEKLQAGLKNCYMDRYYDDLDEVMFLELKTDYNKKIKTVQQSLEELEDKLKLREEVGSSEERVRALVRKYTTFSELTNELVYDFIDYVEVGEKNEKKEQEVVVHWKF